MRPIKKTKTRIAGKSNHDKDTHDCVIRITDTRSYKEHVIHLSSRPAHGRIITRIGISKLHERTIVTYGMSIHSLVIRYAARPGYLSPAGEAASGDVEGRP